MEQKSRWQTVALVAHEKASLITNQDEKGVKRRANKENVYSPWNICKLLFRKTPRTRFGEQTLLSPGMKHAKLPQTKRNSSSLTSSAITSHEWRNEKQEDDDEKSPEDRRRKINIMNISAAQENT